MLCKNDGCCQCKICTSFGLRSNSYGNAHTELLQLGQSRAGTASIFIAICAFIPYTRGCDLLSPAKQAERITEHSESQA